MLTLAVSAAYWGRGIGSTLLTDLLAKAGRHASAEVFLEVRADNPRAQDSTAGSVLRRGIRRGYYQPSGVDAIVMRCGPIDTVLPARRRLVGSRRPPTRPIRRPGR